MLLTSKSPDVGRSVPGLGIATNRDALLELLAEHLNDCRAGLQLLDARIVNVEYPAGGGADVLWKLNVQDPENGRTRRQLIVVRALRRDDAAPSPPNELIARYQALRAQKQVATELPLRTPWLFVEPARLLMHAFPLDPALPTLIDVVDPEALKDALHRAWHKRHVRVRRVSVDTLAYTPGSRAALRLDVLSEDKNTGLPEARRLVGKIDTKRLATRLFAGHWTLWRTTFGRVPMAPPAGYVAVLRLSLQEFLDGERLSDLAGTGRFVGLVREAARAIAGVHGTRLPLLATRGLEKEMRTVVRWTDVLSRLCPERAGRLEIIAGRIRDELSARLSINSTVHGDFHLANVLADQNGVTLIDWDQIAHGDAMVDVGRVLASLRVSSLRIHGTVDGLADVQDSFLAAYLEATRDDENRARLFEAVALLVAAAAPFRLQRGNWTESAHRMIDEVERTLDLAVAGPRVAVASPEAARQVPFDERSRWALDPTYVRSLLVPVVHETHGEDIEVIECTPTVCEQGRHRLHVRWTMKGYRGRERWDGSLEGIGFRDDSGRGRLRRLHVAAAVAAHHADALQLPAPLGHLGPLSMIVFAPRGGESFAAALEQGRGDDTLRRSAAALARFHALRIDLGKERETAGALRGLRRRVMRLESTGHRSAPEVRELMERLEPIVAQFGERRAPTILGLRPQHLRMSGSVVSTSQFVDLLHADPFITVGGLLADFACDALARQQRPLTAARFRAAYAAAAGCSEQDLAPFEALSLLQRACRRGIRRPDDRLAASAIAYAASLLVGDISTTRTRTTADAS